MPGRSGPSSPEPCSRLAASRARKARNGCTHSPRARSATCRCWTRLNETLDAGIFRIIATPALFCGQGRQSRDLRSASYWGDIAVIDINRALQDGA